jgi:hypothetical protein
MKKEEIEKLTKVCGATDKQAELIATIMSTDDFKVTLQTLTTFENSIRDEELSSKVTRVEVIDHTRTFENGGGRVYTYWSEYNDEDIKNPDVTLSFQDEGKTLKIFLFPKESSNE